jgi:hypothetical protein
MRDFGTGLLLMVLLIALPAGVARGEGRPPTWNPSEEERSNIPWMPLKPEDVLTAWEGISMPLGRILLARKGSEYCAIKFTDTWLGETEHDYFSSYDSYCQVDGSGDFTKSNVTSEIGELSYPRIRSFRIIDYRYQKGAKTVIKCGQMKLNWTFIAYIDFDKNELAPTPWTSIKEVNVHDPRIRWYKKDSNRKRLSGPIDQLWGGKEKQDQFKEKHLPW